MLSYFKACIICLQAFKDGYKVRFKDYHGGYILTTIEIDANNGIYLITYVAVKNENHASWYWFLDPLTKDLEIINYQLTSHHYYI